MPKLVKRVGVAVGIAAGLAAALVLTRPDPGAPPPAPTVEPPTAPISSIELTQRLRRPDPPADTDIRERGAHGPIDVLIVRGLAPNNRPQADHRQIPAAAGKTARDGWNLERPGNPENVDLIVGNAGGGKRLDCPLQQSRGYRPIELGYHDCKAAFSRRCVGFVYVGHLFV